MEPIDQPTALVICDAGLLIHLDELDCLDLLAGFQKVLVTEEVRAEVNRHWPSALFSPAFLPLPVRIEKECSPSPDLCQLARAYSLEAA